MKEISFIFAPNMAKNKVSAGIVAYRFNDGKVEVLLGHPGGILWAKRDNGWWSIPKGEFEPTEETPLDAARREFNEETGFEVTGDFIELTATKQKSGKLVYAFALECDVDTGKATSNYFEMEWPPHSGHKVEFPEIDRIEWFGIGEALIKILPGQQPFIMQLVEKLGDKVK